MSTSASRSLHRGQPPLTRLPAWEALAAHRRQLESIHMRDLFSKDPERFARFSLTIGDLLFDYSKNRLTDETITLLVQLAEEVDVPRAISAMFRGETINP